MEIDLSNLVITKVFAAHRIMNSHKGILSKRSSRERWAFALKLQGHTVYKFKQTIIHSDALNPVLLPKGSSYDWECLEDGVCYIIEFDSPITFERPIALSIAENNLVQKSFLRIEQILAARSPFLNLKQLKNVIIFYYFHFLINNKHITQNKKRNFYSQHWIILQSSIIKTKSLMIF